MIGSNLNSTTLAMMSAALSSSIILVCLLVLVNIFPQDILRERYNDSCYNNVDYTRVFRHGANGSVIFEDRVSKEAWQTLLKCIHDAPDEIFPSISEAIDYWRGISAVTMAIPAGCRL
jgi:hypothetical protein